MMEELLDDFRRTRALVVGDCMLDRYVRGHVAKISPEAPVPIVTMQGHQSCLGGAGNVAAGLSALGVATELAGIVGNDADGAVVLELCRKAGIGTRSTIQIEKTNTICKTRILADRGQQLLRLDADGDIGAREQSSEDLSRAVLERLGEFDVVVLSDYEKGSLSIGLIRAVIDACKLLGIPLVVDPKKLDFSVYSGATLLTPNLTEMERATGRRLSTVDDVRSIVQEHRTLWNLDYLLCTCGAEGMVWGDERGCFHVPAEVRPVADVAGAGDTVVAVLAASIGAMRPVA
jgi:D-beta-D-heptose 7-phosphate kinase/D-beta-D-heptose 1-phosphate adenosyltransferase